MKQGQSWSIDLIIAVVIFVLVISVFYAILNQPSENKAIELQLEARGLTTKLYQPQDTTCSFIDGDRIDREKLEACFNADPVELRHELGLTSDFCIYLEDQEGRVIFIRDSAGQDKAGQGIGDITVSNVPCGVAFVP